MLVVSIPVRRGRERGARASERGVANRGVLRDASLLGATDAVVGRRHVVVHLRASAEGGGVETRTMLAVGIAACGSNKTDRSKMNGSEVMECPVLFRHHHKRKWETSKTKIVRHE
jgi:hypothetical protein